MALPSLYKAPFRLEANKKNMDCAFKMFPRGAYEAVEPIKSGGALFKCGVSYQVAKERIYNQTDSGKALSASVRQADGCKYWCDT